jgi:hypothetical protein
MITPIVRKIQEKLFSIGLFERVGGIVELQFQGKKKFPVCLAQNCILKSDVCTDGYLAFMPNSQDLGICYFEFVSDISINNASRFSKLKLVCYWNSGKVETPVHDVIAHVTKAVERVNNRISDTISINGNCRVASIAKDAAVFQKYGYDDSITQYTKYPFEFCVFDLEFSYRFDFNKLGKIILKD